MRRAVSGARPWHRRATLSVRPPLGVAFASAPSASSAGFLQTGLSVAIVVADRADRADGVRPRLNLISVLNTDWKRRRRPPERAGKG